MSERATFGAELRRLRRAAGMPLTELAERIHYSKGYLSKVETGLAKPHAALAALCEAELGVAGALAGLVPQEVKRRREGVARPSGLPVVAGHFAGRAAEIAAIRAVLTSESGPGVCAVSGMGGVGKTALAVWCAHRLEAGFADGCLFLDLRGHSPEAPEVTPADALDRFLRLLGVPGAEIPSDVDDRAALYRDRSRGRSFLIVLDNARSTHQISPLLPAEPKCRVLVTSRHRLAALDDARHLSLEVLPEADAGELFRSLTGAADTEPVARIVERCGRLPLAIRIAAARLRTNPSWNTGELDRRLAVEAARLAELDDGERSVAAAFQLSFSDLPAGPSRLFGLLAVHPGADVDVYSAAALAGVRVREAERLLGTLHDAHLITQQASGRYQFHDLLRVFALDRIPPDERALSRLLEVNLRAAEAGDRFLTPQRYRPELSYDDTDAETASFVDEDDALAWFRVEWPNLVALCQAAGARGLPGRCWQLAFMMRSFFFHSKLWDPWIATHTWALASADELGEPWVRAITANNLGVALIDRGELDAAAEQYRHALAMFREIGDEPGANTVLANYAWVSHYRGEHRIALRDMEIALEYYERSANARNAAITRRGIALVEAALADYPGAIAHAERALAAFDELDLDLDAAMALNCLGWAWFQHGKYDRAASAYQEALARSEDCGSTFEAARAETGLGNVATAIGEHEAAHAHWTRADDTHSSLDAVVVGELRVRLKTSG